MFDGSPLGGARFRAQARAAAWRIASVIFAVVLLAGHPAAAPLAVDPGAGRLAGAGVASAAPSIGGFVLPSGGAGLLLAAERGNSPAQDVKSGGPDTILPPPRSVAAVPAAWRGRPLARQRGAAARPARAFSSRAPPLQA